MSGWLPVLFAALLDAFSPPPRSPAAVVLSAAELISNDSERLLGQVRATSPGATTRAIAELLRFDSASWVAEIDVPTSVLIPLRDRALGVGRQRWLASQIPDAHVVAMDAGHASCTLRSDKFVAALREAVESVHRRLTAEQAS